jgi:hypothetical protein
MADKYRAGQEEQRQKAQELLEQEAISVAAHKHREKFLGAG